MDERVAPACVEPAPSQPEVDVFTLAGAHHTRALRQVCEAAMGELEGDGFLGALLGWTPRGPTRPSARECWPHGRGGAGARPHPSERAGALVESSLRIGSEG